MISDDFQIGPNGAYEHVGNDLDIAYQDLLQDILDNEDGDFGVLRYDDHDNIDDVLLISLGS